MLKRNIFAILIISFALVFTTNIFGQNNKSKLKKKKTTNARIAKPTVKSISRNMDDISNGSYRKTNTPRRKTKNFLPEVNDEVLVKFRKKSVTKKNKRSKSKSKPSGKVVWKERSKVKSKK